jgi:hypothetical protein
MMGPTICPSYQHENVCTTARTPLASSASQVLQEALSHLELISFHARMWRWAELVGPPETGQGLVEYVHRAKCVSKHEDRADECVQKANDKPFCSLIDTGGPEDPTLRTLERNERPFGWQLFPGKKKEEDDDDMGFAFFFFVLLSSFWLGGVSTDRQLGQL